MGAEFIDYIIADEIVLPLDCQRFYTEKAIYLPHTYRPPGPYRTHDIGGNAVDRPAKRKEAGLPERGFVFCCFIAAPVFTTWMRLLKKCPIAYSGWLLWDNGDAERNLRREAAFQGIDPDRLRFAERLPFEIYLKRLWLADLFLDTLPYNAHTTGTDALWAGLPVLTCLGNTFAGRVGGSILSAIGLPELITNSLGEYELLALNLAEAPDLLPSIRQKLWENRLSRPLFDSGGFCRAIETRVDASGKNR
jgi:predicted O-linked N-acetylglucosamine transferase (SPINDLY family)